MEEIITGYFASNVQRKSWANGLLARRAILKVYIDVFSVRLSKVNDSGCWLLLTSFVRSVLVIIPSYRDDVGL